MPFDMEQATVYAQETNRNSLSFRTSARTGRGLNEWFRLLQEIRPAPAQ